MSFEAYIKQRDPNRERLAADIADFLKRGGKITECAQPQQAHPVGRAQGFDGGMVRRAHG